MIDRRMLIAGAAGLAFLPGIALAEDDWEAKRQKQLKEDWPWLGRYADDNAKLKASGQKVDIVFMGDSITEGWREQNPAFFKPGRVGRGIGGRRRRRWCCG
jgi:lysophospholipase L1-like esterase